MSDNTGFRSGVKNITNDRKSRLMLIGAGVLIIGGAIFAFSPSAQNSVSSSLRGPGNMGPNPPGGATASPVYTTTVKDSDSTRARENPTGTLPTPLYNGDTQRVPNLFPGEEETGRTPAPRVEPTPVAAPPSLTIPSAEPAKPAEPVQVAQPAQPAAPPAPVPVTYLPMDRDLINAMQAQMKNILGRKINPSETVYLYTQETGGQNRPVSASSGSTSSGTSVSGIQVPAGSGTPVSSGVQTASAQTTLQRPSRFSAPAPGTILYSRLIGKVNSDVPGPVIAEISQGPLHGARLLGSFQFTEQGVIIQFNTMTIPFTDDGLERTEVVPIKAVAVDAENLGTSMATSIDRRILERIAFGFATSFIQGLGQAVAQAGSTTTVLPSGGVTYGLKNLNTTEQLLSAGGNAAGTAGRIIDQTYGNRRTTIVVDADTPFGLLFLGNGNGNQ